MACFALAALLAGACNNQRNRRKQKREQEETEDNNLVELDYRKRPFFLFVSVSQIRPG
jgi:hypothetical protein